jgi:hypothetical protein
VAALGVSYEQLHLSSCFASNADQCVSSETRYPVLYVACTAGRLIVGFDVLQELQAVKGKVEQLTAERDKALSENVIVRQQRNCHADHAQLLVKENKRLLSQLQALRLQQSQATAALQSSMEKQACTKQQDGRKPAASTVKMRTSEGMISREDDGDSQTSVQGFDGHDIKNALHKKPFDLSKGSRHKQHVSSNAIVKQAQQMRAASRTN